MRKNLLHYWYKELSYEIREIVELANKMAPYGLKISWENIGDPIAKGETFPEWIKEIISEALKNNSVFGYCPSRGLDATREYLAKKDGKIHKNDIIFFNGLGEAINKTYGYLAMTSKVLWPNPAYPTHSSAEATNSGSEHLTYSLDPRNGWNPDLEEIENKVKYNPNITWILVINPDNPTWVTFKREVLEGIVDIARRYDMFVIFDEIYEKLIYNQEGKTLLADIIGEVPWISMKGMSKDIPWPWARCGWIEVYNKERDPVFSRYVDSIYSSKMLEVCSTTLPQYVLPIIYEDPRYLPYIAQRIAKYQQRADLVAKYLGNVQGVIYVKPSGAFYASIVFDMNCINENFEVEISNPELKQLTERAYSGKRFDKKFCYSLLATTGICVVPLSGFNSTYEGFRMTLLEQDEAKFVWILEKIRDFIFAIHK